MRFVKGGEILSRGRDFIRPPLNENLTMLTNRKFMLGKMWCFILQPMSHTNHIFPMQKSVCNIDK